MSYLKFFRRFYLSCFCLGLAMTGPIQADLKYEQSTQVSGAMIEMLKKMPLVGKKMNMDTTSTHYFTANSMRSDTYLNGKPTKSEIVLLNQEQFIEIDHEKKSYTVLTFAQMRQQMEKAIQQMKAQKKGGEKPEATITPKISVKDTGETKTINGYLCRHMIVNMSMEIQDQKTGKTGTMDMVSDMWLTRDVSGFEEQREFYMRMAEKMGTLALSRDMMSGMGAMMQDPNATQGMAEMKKELAKMEGAPILTIVSMLMPEGSMPPEAAQNQKQNPPANEQKPSVQEAASDSVVDQATAKVGKMLGGFGGFGRKKKTETPPKPAAAPSSTQEAAPSSQPAQPAEPQPFMKTTTEMRNFERSGISASLFAPPAGYKLVEARD
jgi:hypothetical protein